MHRQNTEQNLTLLRPIGLLDSLGIKGFFPIVLGILLIVLQRLTQRAKEVGSVAR